MTPADLSIAILAALTVPVLVDAGVRWWSAMGDAYGLTKETP